MPYANVVAPFESFVKDKYPNLNVEQVVELHDYVRFVLTDEGDFDGLSKFVQDTGRDFKAQVELRREVLLKGIRVEGGEVAVDGHRDERRHRGGALSFCLTNLWTRLRWSEIQRRRRRTLVTTMVVVVEEERMNRRVVK